MQSIDQNVTEFWKSVFQLVKIIYRPTLWFTSKKPGPLLFSYNFSNRQQSPEL